MSSIFNRIFRYRQREQRTPREDYFTETFVAVIEKYDELRIALAAWLAEVEGIRSVRIETQRDFAVVDNGNPRRPDVWMEAKDAQDARHWIIVENKIDSGEGENQLADYAKILEAQSGLKSKTLVYITKYTSETESCSRDGVKFKHLRWPKIYDFVQKRNNHRELGVELLRLMEDWRMDGNLSAASLRAMVVSINYEVGGRLVELQNEAWISSGLANIIDGDKLGTKRWVVKLERGEQWIGGIPGYGIALWMGFRFDRRDKDWDVECIEFPSPFIAVTPDGKNKEYGERIVNPSKHWTGPVEDWIDYKWIRQPAEGEIPHLGKSLEEFYKMFFHEAFVELKQALEGIE